jgi:hypothetical protein
MAIGLHFKMAQVSSQTRICPSPHESHVSQNHGLVVTEKLFEGALRAGPSRRNHNSSCKFSYSTSCILQRGNHDTLALEEKRFQTLNSLQATLLLHLQSPEIATCEFTSSQFISRWPTPSCFLPSSPTTHYSSYSVTRKFFHQMTYKLSTPHSVLWIQLKCLHHIVAKPSRVFSTQGSRIARAGVVQPLTRVTVEWNLSDRRETMSQFMHYSTNAPHIVHGTHLTKMPGPRLLRTLVTEVGHEEPVGDRLQRGRAKISQGNLGACVARYGLLDEDISWLDIPMHDSLPSMRRVVRMLCFAVVSIVKESNGIRKL